MFEFIIFGIIIAISFVLAYKSMLDYRQKPVNNILHSIFLVQNPAIVHADFMKKLFHLVDGDKYFVAFEVLYKGSDKALVFYGPRNLQTTLSEAKLLEIEDYQGQLEFDKVDLFEVSVKGSDVEYVQQDGVFDDLGLKPEEKFFWQVVLSPETNSNADPTFQATIRALIYAENATRKAEIRKIVEDRIAERTNLTIHRSSLTLDRLFNAYQHRSLIPSELVKFPMVASQLADLIRKLWIYPRQNGRGIFSRSDINRFWQTQDVIVGVLSR